MNTNWSKILLFTLLGFALGFAICCLTCGRCHRGGSCHGGGCGKEMSCHGDMGGASCMHHDAMGGATCGHHAEGRAACCKGGHGMGHGESNVKVIVADLEKAGFQGDTTVAIDGGTVHVNRTGDSTTVKVEMKEEMKEVVHAH